MGAGAGAQMGVGAQKFVGGKKDVVGAQTGAGEKEGEKEVGALKDGQKPVAPVAPAPKLGGAA